jgi:amino acid efflux transporter
MPLRPTLGLAQGVALYVGAVLGTGALVLPSIAAETAGPASLVAWLGLSLLSLPLALTYAALSRERPDARGFSEAIERAFGPRWGAAAGWLFLAQVPTATVIAALIAGQYAASAYGGGRDAAFALGGGLVLVAYAINAVGLRVSASVQLGALAVIAGGMAIVVARAAPQVETAAFSPWAPHGTAAVGVAAAQLFWAFVGWEAITPLAEEFRDPRDIRRASLLAVAVVAVFYVALAAVTIGTRAYGAALGSQAPLTFLAGGSFGSSGALIVGVAGFVLTFAPLNAYVAGSSRLAYALGRRGQLPDWLGVASASGTPRRALAGLGLLCAAAIAVAYVAGLGIADLLAISTSSFIATYVLSMAAAVRLLRAPLRHAAALSLVACVAILVFVGPLLLWLACVTAFCLAYQRLREFRGRARPAALAPRCPDSTC